MSKQKVLLGKWGEDKAAEYLTRKGYKIIDRNVHTKYGEIDLIAKKENVLFFVEVKTRISKEFGYPEEAITPSKLSHMIDSAQTYMEEKYTVPVDWQMDVISIQTNSNRLDIDIYHLENVHD